MDEEKLERSSLPRAPRRKHGMGDKAGKSLGNELAAIAFVAMENGDYRHEGHQNYDKDGNPTINKSELMRLAGYSQGSIHQFDTTLGRPGNKEFWQLVALYRIRRTDPMFRKEQEKQIIGQLASKITHELYEAMFYYPHTISFRDKLAALKTIVDLGYRVAEPDKERESRSNRLLDSLPEDQRKAALAGLKKKLSSDLEGVEALEQAHEAADRE
jgi:hypothetical protein